MNAGQYPKALLGCLLAMAFSALAAARDLVPQATAQAAKPGQVPELVWPAPPDEARVKYVGSLSSETDLAAKKKRRSLKDILLGKEAKKVLGLAKPTGVCTDSKGRVLVADGLQGLVVVFDRANRRVSVIGDGGAGKLQGPLDVAVDESDNIYVSDYKRRNVVVFDREGRYLLALAAPGELENPVGLAYDRKNGRILVADSKAHRVLVYGLRGGLVAKFGEGGVQEGQFRFPTFLAMGPDGFVYVVDTLNFRVQVFDAEYRYYDDFGLAGVGAGQFARPKGIAVDSDKNIYVADAAFGNLQIFDQDYRLLLAVGEGGTGPGQLTLPAGIHIDGQDFIYVADTNNGRIQIFQYLKQR